MKVDFKNHPIEKMKNVLRKYRNKRGGEIEEVIIVWQDNQEVKHSFDFTSIVRSIATDADKNSNGHYLNEDVQKLLFHQIRWEIMYKKNVILLISIGLLTLSISCYFKWQYKVITSDVMAFISIAIGLYIAAILFQF